MLTVDSDSLIEPRTVSRIAFDMLSQKHVIMVGGGVYILNSCRYKNGVIEESRLSPNPIVSIQICEYIRSFLFGRSGWNAFKGSLSFSGTLSLFEHALLIKIGGFDLNNYAQDAEVVMCLHAYMRKRGYPYKILFSPEAFAWTEVPSGLIAYWHQRSNWQVGLLRSIVHHRKLLLNLKYGIVGLFTYPFFVVVEVFGPLVEMTAYTLVIISWWLGILDTTATVLLVIISWGFVTFLTMANMLINLITFNKYKRLIDILWTFVLVFLESFGFRQYMTLARVFGTLRFIGKRLFSKKKM